MFLSDVGTLHGVIICKTIICRTSCLVNLSQQRITLSYTEFLITKALIDLCILQFSEHSF
jgi:hypothetical protein